MARPKKAETTEEAKKEKTNNPKKNFIFAVGRRREAVARVRLYVNPKEDVVWGELSLKKGDIVVNQLPIEKYFATQVSKASYTEPFRITNTLGKLVATIKVEGGGKQGQLGAIVQGITRALVLYDKDFRPVLKKKGLLTRDARVRERRKVGMGGKARRKKQSPKR